MRKLNTLKINIFALSSVLSDNDIFILNLMFSGQLAESKAQTEKSEQLAFTLKGKIFAI